MIDNYTEFMHQVIAVSTTFIAFWDSGLIPRVTAARGQIAKVTICGYINSNYCGEMLAHPIKGNVLKTSDIKRSD